jgi:hypothetical protein
VKRGAPLKRTGRLNPVGKKALKDRTELARVRVGVLARGCEFHLAFQSVRLLPPTIRCWGALAVHHIRPRSDDGSNRVENLACLCAAHHDWVHNGDPVTARRVGLLV